MIRGLGFRAHHFAFNPIGSSFALNFFSGGLDPRVTFTRSTTATFTNSSGLIQSAAIDQPRFDYNPITLASNGLLIEEQRTNLLIYSQEFENAAWVKANSTITANAAIAPDGTTTADKLIANTTAAVPHGIQRNISTTGSVVISFYAKAAEYSFVAVSSSANNFVYFDLANGVVFSTAGTGWSTPSITPAGNGWYRCIAVTSVSNTRYDIYVSNVGQASGNTAPIFTGDNISGVLLWGAQLEAGSYVTSYIPTVASSVVRNADTASVSTLTPWYNATEGTVYAEIQKLSPSSVSTYAYELLGSTGSFSMRVRLGTDARIQSVDGGVVQVDSQLQGSVPTTASKYAFAYKLNDYAGSANGAAVVTDTSGTVPAISSLSLGAAAINGLYLRRITYYPRRLSNTELQAITA